jgi:hypothetical protein
MTTTSVASFRPYPRVSSRTTRGRRLLFQIPRIECRTSAPSSPRSPGWPHRRRSADPSTSSVQISRPPWQRPRGSDGSRSPFVSICTSSMSMRTTASGRDSGSGQKSLGRQFGADRNDGIGIAEEFGQHFEELRQRPRQLTGSLIVDEAPSHSRTGGSRHPSVSARASISVPAPPPSALRHRR